MATNHRIEQTASVAGAYVAPFLSEQTVEYSGTQIYQISAHVKQSKRPLGDPIQNGALVRVY